MDSSPTLKPSCPNSLDHPHLFHNYPPPPPPPPHHHHHYHIHPSPHCPFHNLMLHPITHLPTCPLSVSHGRTTQTTLSSFEKGSNFQVFESQETPMEYAQMTQDGDEQFGAEEDEEPVFVLTDEWREFFAKSEAKRRLAKRQAKKEGKR